MIDTMATPERDTVVWVTVPEDRDRPSPSEMWDMARRALALHPDADRIRWRGLTPPTDALAQGLVVPGPRGPETWRVLFWQCPTPWIRGRRAADYPLAQALVGGSWKPLRPPKPVGEVYRRHDPVLGAWFSLRTLDITGDLNLFNRWQNTPRVERFWEEGGDLATHRTYLETLAADPRVVTLLGCLDDRPFAYFEVYWAREDRIAPYYPTASHDRGIHMLVGEDSLRGPHRVACWLPSLAHYIFLDDPRTETILSEPRADNDRMIGHMLSHGFHRARTFDFPHKRAALMVLTRERFFETWRPVASTSE